MANSVIISSAASHLLKNDNSSHVFVFGYGSLVWRPNFAYIEQHECYVTNYVRRFHQASTDHRGDERYPGRVVTLEPTDDVNERCRGLVYLIHSSQVDEIFKYLNEREIGGYELTTVEAMFDSPKSVDGHPEQVTSVQALVYLATHENKYYAGPDTIPQLSERIAKASGESGPNYEYLFRLYEWLAERNAADEHITQLYKQVNQLLQDTNSK